MSQFNVSFNEKSMLFNVGFANSQIVDNNNIKVATDKILGGIKVGNNLTITEEGVLSVDTASEVEKDNTKPITSAAVFMEVGNIEALLSAL